MRVALAVVFGLGIFAIGFATLRGLARPRARATLEAVEAPPTGVRVVYWCENCGAELLLIRTGSPAPPRHCGEPMVRREEVLHE